MHVGHGRSSRLGKAYFRARQQGAKQQIGKRQHDVKILVHVTMVQDVVPVEPEEDAISLHLSIPGNVHAPVQVFIGSIVETNCQERTTKQRDATYEKRERGKRNLGEGDQCGSVPPGHGHSMPVLLPAQVVGLIRLENPVMHHGMPLKGIVKFAQGPVHHITVQDPFEAGVKKSPKDEPQQQPQYKQAKSQNVFLFEYGAFGWVPFKRVLDARARKPGSDRTPSWSSRFTPHQ